MTPHRAALIVLVSLVVSTGPVLAQRSRPTTGPVIQSAGRVFDLPHMDFAPPLDMTYRVAFDVSRAGSSSGVNQSFDSAARFLNMHAQAGVPAERLQLALVIHGAAAADLLRDEEYGKQTNQSNPNVALVEELSKAGVRFIVCGQTAASRGYTKDMFLEPVEVSLSAMTAFAVLQARGYHVNPF